MQARGGVALARHNTLVQLHGNLLRSISVMFYIFLHCARLSQLNRLPVRNNPHVRSFQFAKYPQKLYNECMKKTNAMRILDSAGIEYRCLEYEDDGEHKLELGAAARTAQKLGLDPAAVFKTIVMRTDTKEVVVFCLSALHEVSAKKARALTGAKEISSVRPEELLSLTGYVRGACTPVGMRRRYRTFIDEHAFSHSLIHVSAGVRGQQLGLAPDDLLAACNGERADIVL